MTGPDFQIDSFMLYCSSKNLAKKTMGSYEQTLKLFAQYMQQEHGIDEVGRIQSGHLRHYIKFLRERGKYTVAVRESTKQINYPDNRTDYKKPVSTTTIANYVRNIKVFFNYLHTVEREINKNPMDTIERIKADRKIKQTLTPDELKKLFKAFDTTRFHEYRNATITKLLYDTGMRVGECLAILPEHLNIPYRSILVTNPKNKRERYVYFSPSMGNELKRWLQYKDRYVDSVYIFPTSRGTRLEIRNFEYALRQTSQRIGFHVHPHLLRNNFAKYYLLNGGDWVSLSRILGHSSVEVTQKCYLDFSDEEIGKKYQKHSPLAHLDD